MRMEVGLTSRCRVGEEMELEIEKEMEKVAHIDADGDGAGLEQEEKARSSRHPERLRSAGEGAGAALARVYPALVPTSLLLPRLRLHLASAGPLPLLERRSRLAHCRLLFLGHSAWHGTHTHTHTCMLPDRQRRGV
jgi:hypothetical protein